MTTSDGVIVLLHQTASSPWPNDYRSLWQDLLGTCNTASKDRSPNERPFTVIIRGLGKLLYKNSPKNTPREP